MAGAGFLLANNFLNGENAGTAASKYVSISEFNGKTKETNEEFYVYGKVSQLADGSTSFTLVDGNSNLTIQTDGMSTQTGGALPKADTSKIANDQYVLVKGITSDDGYSLLAQNVKPITEDEFNTYKSFKIPKLSMTVTNIPRELKHGCDNLPISVKLKNTGKVAIDYTSMNNYQANYMMYYLVNGTAFGSATGGTADTPQRIGFKDFGTINPGQTVEATFNGGGWVTKGFDKAASEAQGSPYATGTGGSPNIIAYNSQSGGIVGNNTIQFKFALVKNDDGTASIATPQYTSESNIVSTNLLQWDCDLTDVDEEVYQ